MGLINELLEKWQAAEKERREFHARELVPLVEQELTLRQRLTVARKELVLASTLGEIAQAREKVTALEGEYKAVTQRLADVQQVLGKLEEKEHQAKAAYEQAVARKRQLQEAVRLQETTVANRRKLVAEAERELEARRQSLEESLRVLQRLQDELATL